VGGWLLVALVVYLSLTSTPPLFPLPFHWNDKLEHALAYGTLMGWFMQIYPSSVEKRYLAAVLIGMGLLMEVLQGFGGTRLFDYWDMAANTLGVLLVWRVLHPKLTDLFFRVERYARG
jgi:VanZ family protein